MEEFKAGAKTDLESYSQRSAASVLSSTSKSEHFLNHFFDSSIRPAASSASANA
jgi:hypothetical protein